MENNRNNKKQNKRGMFGLPYVMSIDTDMVQEEKIKTGLRIRGGPTVVYSGGQDIIGGIRNVTFIKYKETRMYRLKRCGDRSHRLLISTLL